ncbi:outer membrane transport energization protein ExbD [Roseovarius azorensis]|uniref:Outer membrane transport energization protein ExbD n=1 Tax=Roseovarius azorensis TaxID=1287727 RepID=A0A1H7M086_9RHOB|nr:biopolymer transporter ExbD [Roseovarius azorensis]SEL04145.1 outer membrane transport energization protein ExbD [Roseovarius azorensis]
MRSAPFKRRKLSLTSLIDVIFLLLLFFMLSSTFSQFSEVDLATAGAGPVGGAEVLPVFVQLRADGLRVNAREVTLKTLPETLAPLIEGGKARVLVSMGADVTAQRLTDLLLVLRRVQELSVQVLVPS